MGVAAPRAVSSTASPTRPPCEVLRPSRPAAAQAAANRRFTWLTPRRMTESPGSGAVAACRRRTGGLGAGAVRGRERAGCAAAGGHILHDR